jgi:four helix bundle protein
VSARGTSPALADGIYERRDDMPFDTYHRSVDLVREVASLLDRFDSGLADQARRAAVSVALNVVEARERTGKDQRNRYRIALGSAAEVAACLDLAEVLGYVGADDVVTARALIDRVRAMTWRLSR